MPGVGDEVAGDSSVPLEHAASRRIQVEPLGIDTARFGESAVHPVGDRGYRIEVRGTHRAPAAGHDEDRKGATTAPVTRRGRPLALSRSAHTVRARTCTRPSSPVNSMYRSNFAPCGASATQVRAVTRPPGPSAR